MNTPTKARISLTEGILELEGSEEFVTKYLDEFKAKMGEPASTKKIKLTQRKKITSVRKDEGNTIKERKKIASKKIEVEEFKIDGDSKSPSLKEFLEEKKATRSIRKLAVAVGYYITQFLNLAEFSEGNIAFVHKALRLKGGLGNLHQTLINCKNSESWFDQGNDASHWKLSRIGELYVKESMPGKSEAA